MIEWGYVSNMLIQEDRYENIDDLQGCQPFLICFLYVRTGAQKLLDDVILPCADYRTKFGISCGNSINVHGS